MFSRTRYLCSPSYGFAESDFYKYLCQKHHHTTMKAIKHLVALLFTAVILTGCTTYYGYGISGVNPVHFDKSGSKDSASVPITVSGSYSNTFLKMTHEQEYSHHASIAVSGHKELEMMTFFYGGHGYFGNYQVFNTNVHSQEVIVGDPDWVPTPQRDYKFDHQFYGGGLSAEVDMNFKLYRGNYYIGFQPNLYVEKGSFSRFRDSITAIKDTLGWDRHSFSNLGNSPLGGSFLLITGMSWSDSKTTFGGEMSFGTATAIPLTSKMTYPTFDTLLGLKAFIKQKGYTVFGQFSSSWYSGGALSLGVAYSFW